MSQMINRAKEMLRISPSRKTKIEYSVNSGRSWHPRFGGGRGDFLDLVDNGKEILGTTSNGLFYSTNEGRSWHKRS